MAEDKAKNNPITKNLESSGSFYSLFNFKKYKDYIWSIDIGFDIKNKIEDIWIYFQNIFKKYENEFKINDDDVILLRFCNISYTIPENRPLEYMWYDLQNDVMFNNHIFATYVNNTEKKIVITYKWTDIKNIHDIVSDLETILWVNAIDQRLFTALSSYDTIKSKYPDYLIYICWHSLGGTISYLIMRHRNADRCTVFNPWSVPNKLFLDMAEDTLSHDKWVKNIYTYRVLWDPISTFSYVGNTKIFRVSDPDPLRLHSLQIFFDNSNIF